MLAYEQQRMTIVRDQRCKARTHFSPLTRAFIGPDRLLVVKWFGFGYNY